MASVIVELCADPRLDFDRSPLFATGDAVRGPDVYVLHGLVGGLVALGWAAPLYVLPLLGTVTAWEPGTVLDLALCGLGYGAVRDAGAEARGTPASPSRAFAGSSARPLPSPLRGRARAKRVSLRRS